MRVTEKMRLTQATISQSRNAGDLDKASRIAARGARVAMPSDDPLAYAEKIRSDHSLATLEKRSQLALKASGELDVAEGALSHGIDILVQARAAAVQGATDTLDPGARKLLAAHVNALRDELLGVANTKYGTSYLFAGTRTDTAPFDPTGTFVGNDAVARIALMDGVSPPANVSGARAFTATGGRDVFAELTALATALDTDDVAAVQASIDGIDGSHQQLIRAQLEAGLSSERFRSAIEVMSATTQVITEARAKRVEGDPAEHLTNLTSARTAYERSVAVTRQLLNISTLGQST